MNAREALIESAVFGDDLEKALPIINPDGSDSAMFDNALEFWCSTARSLAHAIMMMIPEPWQKHETMPDDKRLFMNSTAV